MTYSFVSVHSLLILFYGKRGNAATAISMNFIDVFQPDVVAIWWGHQNNPQNMNYELIFKVRCYNKKIITKVNSGRSCVLFLLYLAPGNAKQILEWNHN